MVNRFKVTAESLTMDGKGIGKLEENVGNLSGKTFFCDNILPGETGEIEIIKDKGNYVLGRLISLEKTSPFRQSPECSAFERCGGCSLQMLSYDKQREVKKEQVISCLMRIGGFPLSEIQAKLMDVRGMESPSGYRNHVQYQAQKSSDMEKSQSIELGFYGINSHSFVAHDHCLLVPPVANRLREETERFFYDLNIIVQDEKNEGVSIARVILRFGFSTGDIMLILELKRGDDFPYPEYIDCLQKTLEKENSDNPGDVPWHLTSVWEKRICAGRPAQKTTAIYRHVWGKDHIIEKIGEKIYRISPDSFFQVNTKQTQALYETIRELALWEKGEAAKAGMGVLLDLYCGAGTIGIYLSGFAKSVVGIEINPASVRDARINAEINGADNITFIEGKAEDFFFGQLPESPDAVILDPPRKGCDRRLLEKVLSLLPSKIIYVSCDPATLARDLKILHAGGYEIERIQPVDMFPWTGHVECVCALYRTDT